jgi:hypothetical protein
MNPIINKDKGAEEMEEVVQEEDRSALGKIEEMVGKLLAQYQELKKERDELAGALNQERQKSMDLEKKLEMLSLDKEKVKTRIDQLLYRLKEIDL